MKKVSATAGANKIPVFVLSGGLGSGKTTFLSKLIDKYQITNVRIVVNEIGEVTPQVGAFGYEQEQIILIRGGCVCCAKRGDLIKALENLISNETLEDLPDAVIIETSGVSNPGPIAHTIATSPRLSYQFFLAQITHLIDPLAPASALGMRENIEGVSIADVVVITKVDLANADTIQETTEWVATQNPTSEIYLSSLAKDIKRVTPPPRNPSPVRAKIFTPGKQEPHHGFSTVEIELPQTINWHRLATWLSCLLHAHGSTISRVKGAVPVGDTWVSINTVHHSVMRPEHAPMDSHGEGGGQLVVIARGIDPESITRSFQVFVTNPLAAKKMAI